MKKIPKVLRHSQLLLVPFIYNAASFHTTYSSFLDFNLAVYKFPLNFATVNKLNKLMAIVSSLREV